MNKIKAVIFDMDGVLIDAKEWHYDALNKALDGGHEFNIYFRNYQTFTGTATTNKTQSMRISVSS